ncbi:MAG: sulfatase [Alphaproteobacteria bacterium]|nr:sulfatase [Alphaproteobacteria bacterium]
MRWLLLLLMACNGTKPVDDSRIPPESPADSAPELEPIELSPALVLDGARPRNVVIVSVDTLRRDHVNAFGYSRRVTTPTIDRFLTEGVALTQHRSCSSWTFPSMLCLLTGKDQISLGYWPPNHLTTLPPPAPDDLTLMAERFQAAGYHTMLAAASGFLGEASNMDQGIDRGVGRFYNTDGDWVSAEDLLTEVDQLMATRPEDQPFFLHVHFLDPHMPYIPPGRYLDELEQLEPTSFDLSTHEGTLQLWRAFPELNETAQRINLNHLEVRYDGALRYTDDQIALLLARLDAAGVWEDSVLMFFADHGEEFWDHGNFNHGYTAYDEVTRSLAAFWMPGRLRPAQVEALTTHEDLLPSLGALVGLELPGDLTGQVVGSGERDFLYNLSWRGENTVQSVTDGQAKLIYRWDGSKAFYQLNNDPGEQDNLYDPESARVLAFWQALEPELTRFENAEGSVTPVDPGP